jgi:hypothetical protein
VITQVPLQVNIECQNQYRYYSGRSTDKF